MPVLRALAGRSPSCEAVFVQMEHCAHAPVEENSNISNTDNIRRHFFIILKRVQKYAQKGKPTSEAVTGCMQEVCQVKKIRSQRRAD